MKQTEIGLIPEDWEVKSLGEIGEPCMCKRILKEQTSPTGDIPFYKIGTFGGIPDAYISRELFEQYKEQYNYPKKGTLLLSAAGTIGRVVVFDGKDSYFQDSNIVWIDNDETKVTNDFLFYCYSRMQWKTEEGGIVSRLYNANLKSTSFIAPKSLAEQERIAKALSDVDALISTTEKLIQKKKNIKQGAMQNLLTGKKRLPGFGDKQTDLFVPNGTHTKEVKDVSPEQIRLSAKMKQTELGEIPEDWEVKTLGEICVINPTSSNIIPDQFFYVDLESVNSGKLKKKQKISRRNAPSRAQRQFEKNDILYQTVRPYQRNNLFVNFDSKNYIASTGYAIIRSNNNVDAHYIYQIIHMDNFVNIVLDNCTGTSYPAINPKFLKTIPVIIPTKEEQTAIANVLSSMDKEIEYNKPKIWTKNSKNSEFAVL